MHYILKNIVIATTISFHVAGSVTLNPLEITEKKKKSSGAAELIGTATVLWDY